VLRFHALQRLGRSHLRESRGAAKFASILGPGNCVGYCSAATLRAAKETGKQEQVSAEVRALGKRFYNLTPQRAEIALLPRIRA
jgi:hypothetical protein